jgi:integrase/recombinase XerC
MSTSRIIRCAWARAPRRASCRSPPGPAGAARLAAGGKPAPPRSNARFVDQGGQALGSRAVQLRLRHNAAPGLPVGIAAPLPAFLRHPPARVQPTCAACRNCSGTNIGTRRSTHLDFQHLARIYESSHPRARRRG